MSNVFRASRLRILAVCGCASLLFSCSDSEELPPIPEPPAPVAPVEPVNPPPQEPDTTPPDATILFPSQVSQTQLDTITVSGFSTDESEISRVSVNGIDATLENDSVLQRTNWSASIPTASSITIETEDSRGNIDLQAASAILLNLEVPIVFSVDNVNHQFIGSFNNDRIVTRDLDSGADTFHDATFPPSFSWPRFFKYIDTEGKLAAIDDCCDDNFHLTLSETGSFDFSTEFTYQVPKTTGDWNFKHTNGISYDPDGNRVFINFTLFFDSGILSHVIQYDFDTKEVSVIADGFDVEGSAIRARDMTFTNGALYFSTDLDQSFQKLPLDTLTLEDIDIAQDYFPNEVLSSPGHSDIVYVIGFNGIAKVDFNSNEFTEFSKQSDQADLFLSQFYENDIDELNNKVLIGDHDLDMIVGVDIETGERTRFYHSGVGFGKAIIDPWALALDEPNNRIFLFDSGGNAPETVLSVDMTTGNRVEIGEVNRTSNWETNSLVFDAEENKVYAIFPNQIAMVDIDSNTTEELTGNGFGGGVTVSWMDNGVLDKANNRLLVTDYTRIIAVDLTTGFRSVFSSAEDNVGSGEAFGNIGGLAINTVRNYVFATGVVVDKPGLFEVALDSGDRNLVDNICADIPAYSDILTYDTYYPHHPVILSAAGNMLYMFGKEMITLDLKTNACHADKVDYGRDVVKTELGQWFTVSQNEMIQFDPATNQRVTVSK